MYLGRVLRTKETLPDFRKRCRVTRHSRIFRGLTGSQRTPQIWGVIVQAEFSRLFLDRSDRIFGTVFGQFRIVLRFGFNLETDVFEFCYHSNLLMNGTKKKWFMVMKGPRGALFYMGLRFCSFIVYCWKNK